MLLSLIMLGLISAVGLLYLRSEHPELLGLFVIPQQTDSAANDEPFEMPPAPPAPEDEQAWLDSIDDETRQGYTRAAYYIGVLEPMRAREELSAALDLYEDELAVVALLGRINREGTRQAKIAFAAGERALELNDWYHAQQAFVRVTLLTSQDHKLNAQASF